VSDTRYRVRECDEVATEKLVSECGLSPWAAGLLARRGMSSKEGVESFLAPRLRDLTPPDSMADLDVAVDRIGQAIRTREQIVVFGDYDVDGATSATIMAGVIERLGGRVEVLVANRFAGGYGFSEPALARALKHHPGLIITCDCGSSDHERVAAAQVRGVDVIVIDHHLVPEETLPAVAFLNPHRPECGFPYKGLCSAGLAFLVGAGLRRASKANIDMREWLDLVALGTVADVAPLDGDNRRLVRAGLRRIETRQVRPGVQALCEVSRMRKGSPVGAVDIAFRLAPRLNAPGRLGDPSLTVALLRARDITEARALASEIEKINNRRKRLSARMTDEALAQVVSIYGEAPAAGVVLGSEKWNRGVVGIVAARVSEQYGVPAVVIGFDGVGHGSARAPDGFPVYDALDSCREHLLSMGGHQAAAGLSVEEGAMPAFREQFTEVSARLAAVHGSSERMLEVDLEVNPFDSGAPTADELLRFEPVGAGNAEPLFAFPGARIVERKEIGKGNLSLRLSWGAGETMRAFGYGMWHLADTLPEQICPLGHLRLDGWRNDGSRELHLLAPHAVKA